MSHLPVILAANPAAAGTDPLVALLAGVAFLAAVAAFFWPRRGLWDRWRRLRRSDARVLAEDALKHLCHCELERREPTLASLAGALQITLARAAEVVRDLHRRRLVRHAEGCLHLTNDGRRYGMNVIRAHRLWERHLADQTGVAEAEWHEAAEEAEHQLTPEQTEALAASLGRPLLDPHGDPIPTAEGEVRTPPGQTLETGRPGQTFRIAHIEDEPANLYAQLMASGLYVGQELQVTENQPDRITFWADGREHRLAPVAANSVTVTPAEPAVARTARVGRALHELEPGQEAVIRDIAPACRGVERRRFLDLGILPGTRIRAEFRSPSGDPTAYRVRDTLIALRRDQARWILIDPVPESASPAASETASQTA
ncbi:MAG: DNA-binding protein [Verrucomicrobia bacterium]|nr:MAG: DNA-binding protein [Verrucomicrobiota bacterium]